MHGYRKANLALVNQLFTTNCHIGFEKASHQNVDELIYKLISMKNYIDSYYSNDEILLLETTNFLNICRRILGTIENYCDFFINHDNEIRHFINFIKRHYKQLYEDEIDSIIMTIRTLRVLEENAFRTSIEKMLGAKKFLPEETVIITKMKLPINKLQVGNISIRMMNEKEFLKQGNFVEVLIFIGSPNYIDLRFSEVFYSHNLYFIAYESFENKFIKQDSYQKIIAAENQLNTIYRNVSIEPGTDGVKLKELSNELTTKENEIKIISQYEKHDKEDLTIVEAKLAIISNHNFIFLPLRQKINIIERETLKILQSPIKEIGVGDLLLFRTQNANKLIRDVADEILGLEAQMHRENVEIWKRKLRKLIRINGIEKVSRVYRKKEGLEAAYIHNLKYWVSDFSIQPRCLSTLLNELNINKEQQLEIQNSTKLIVSAHISAGRKISNSLMEELDQNLENIIEERGYFAFTSNVFDGTTFNIEEIRKLSNETFFVQEKDTLKIIKS
ncbi:hypothetical protein CQS04_09720 [Chryseomicrobium excrementi]|uniref:Uncharacterized protein n=1 Tax=Chryseomicrobium excrementi TaxID=2041346 RepID=A0A2M9EY97_9BACL|nr:hypothetical protein [Chryseomicrobium excrementi]PJK16181.1 hypothetical protein CQS04_09720 [Chryseomicrobium excrementi]